jgi:hypothetical protein
MRSGGRLFGDPWILRTIVSLRLAQGIKLQRPEKG